MKYDIYKSKRTPGVYAVVEPNGNYAVCVEGEEPDGFIGFDPAGRWELITLHEVPAWLREQIEEEEE